MRIKMVLAKAEEWEDRVQFVDAKDVFGPIKVTMLRTRWNELGHPKRCTVSIPDAEEKK